MAFLAHAQSHEAGGGGVADRSVSHPAVAIAADFTPVEWQVIGLARTDGRASLRPPGRWAGLQKLVFGERPDRRLANGRLEALRRLAVDAWHNGYAVHLSHLATFSAAGFSDNQLETLLARISAGRSARLSRS